MSLSLGCSRLQTQTAVCGGKVPQQHPSQNEGQLSRYCEMHVLHLEQGCTLPARCKALPTAQTLSGEDLSLELESLWR